MSCKGLICGDKLFTFLKNLQVTWLEEKKIKEQIVLQFYLSGHAVSMLTPHNATASKRYFLFYFRQQKSSKVETVNEVKVTQALPVGPA